jgi:uncharacterized protein (TIGR03437 family)
MKQFCLLLVFAFASFAQSVDWDNSGNNLLNGVYSFREALWITDLNASDALDEAASQYGTITFDGNGNYTANVTSWSSRDNAITSYTRSGTYAISASGFGFIRRPPSDGLDVNGMVSNGVFVGSGTESGFNNIFIAAKQDQSTTTANFNTPYSIAYTNVATPNLSQIRDASFQIAPTGNGALSAIQVSGYTGGNYTATTQTVNGATYSFDAGVGTLNLGAKNATDLISGSMQFYVAQGGQFIFGGQANGWDMMVGVRTGGTGSNTYSGLYYESGMDVNRSPLPAGTAALDSYFGAFNVITSAKQIIGHQRLQTAPDAAYDYTYSDPYNLTNNTHEDFIGFLNTVSSDNNFRIGFGRGDYLGVSVAMKAQTFSGTGVFLDPTGVVNAASFTPFTTGIAPGQLITLFGTGFAADVASDPTFPTTLGTMQVTINGVKAPLYYVSPTQINAVVPFETLTGVAEITVSKSGATSNRVTVYVNQTAPGVFAVPATGLGYAAALHGDYSLITPQNPAKPGEAVMVYLTGLGRTNPQIATGAAGPSAEPLARALLPIDVNVNNRIAQLLYAGMAPGLRGYQVNIVVPATTPGGDQYVDVGGPDALNSQILLPISGTRAATQVKPRKRPAHGAAQSSLRTRSVFKPGAVNSAADSPSRSR